VILEQGFGNLAGAEKLLRESEQVIRKALGPRHLYVTMPLTQLGMVQELRKNDDEAMTSYTEALEIARDTVGLAHPKVLIIVERLSAIYRRKKQADKVTALFKELLEAKRERYGDNHVFVADTLQLLASHEFEMGNFVQEERLLKEALAIYQASGNRPPRLYGVCLNLRGTNLCRRKQYAASEGYFRDAIKVNRQLHRKAHPDLAQAQLNLVFSLFQQKQYTEEAEGLLHEVDQLLPALQESDQTRLRHGWVVRSTDLLCQRKGGHEQAAHLLDRFLSSSKESTQVEAFAIGYVACLKALSQDSTIPGEKRTPLEAHYSVSAVKCFRQAWKLAPERRFAWIETPPPELKERAEFQMLLAEIRKSKT
jgi:tetratricopeptide (TPR) repeat protein